MVSSVKQDYVLFLQGWIDFIERKEVLESISGILTIEADIQIYTDCPKSWIPKFSLGSDMRKLLHSSTFADVTFVVQDQSGKQLSDPQTVSVVRNFRNDPNDVLAKDNEENIIRKEMKQSAVMQIMRRMKAIAQ